MSELLTVSYQSIARLMDPWRDIASILQESRARNAYLDVTGILLADGQRFLQTLEGPPEAVGTLMLSIILDRRHYDVVPFGIRPLAARKFPTWSMKLLGPNATARIAPDLAELDFSDKRLDEIHAMTLAVAKRSLPPSAIGDAR